MKYALLLITLFFHCAWPMEETSSEYSTIRTESPDSDLELINEYMTQLMRAVEASEFDVAQALIKNKADVNASNTPTNPAHVGKFTDGKTPLTLAIANHDTRMVKLLLENKANPNQPNRIGWTALHLAYYFHSEFDNSKIIKLLLQHNANPHQPTTVGWQTPVEYAGEFLKEHDTLKRNLESFSLEFANNAKKYGYKSTQLISLADYVKILKLEQWEYEYENIKQLCGPGPLSPQLETEWAEKKQAILDAYQEEQTFESFTPETLKSIMNSFDKCKAEDNIKSSDSDQNAKSKKIQRALSSPDMHSRKNHVPRLHRGLSFLSSKKKK